MRPHSGTSLCRFKLAFTASTGAVSSSPYLRFALSYVLFLFISSLSVIPIFLHHFSCSSSSFLSTPSLLSSSPCWCHVARSFTSRSLCGIPVFTTGMSSVKYASVSLFLASSGHSYHCSLIFLRFSRLSPFLSFPRAGFPGRSSSDSASRVRTRIQVRLIRCKNAASTSLSHVR